jgi:hypothetical protein
LRIGDGAKSGANNSNLLDVRSGANTIFAITENGSIIWGANSSPTKVLYAKTQLSAPNKSYEDYKNSDNDDWHKIKDPYDYYASYSYDGGYTWGSPILI